MNNIKKLYNLFQTVCLKYKDTVISLKLTDYKTLFKDNYPEIYDKFLSLFEIITNNDNINIIEDKISDLKNKLQDTLNNWRDSDNSFPTDELESLISYLNDYLTDTNKLNSVDYINIYTHLLTDDLTPLTETDKKVVLDIIINNYIVDTGYNPNSLSPLPEKEDLIKYNPEVNSQFYHFLYNKDYINNINLDPIYCDRHYKLKQNDETLGLEYINYNSTQMSRGNFKKLISDKLEFNETGDLYTDKIRHIIGDIYDRKSLAKEIVEIKNKKKYLDKNNKFDTNLLLNKSLEQIYQIYSSLPNGSDIIFNIIKDDLFNSTVFDKYYVFLLYDRKIDEKYFNGRISYFNNFIRHMCNFSNIMSGDSVITKYDLSLLYNYARYDAGIERIDELAEYLYMEIKYMENQYNKWYESIKKSIGFETEVYNKSQDTLRQLAEKNNDLELFNKYMDINYSRILDVNKDLPLFEEYNCIKVIGKILNKWIELMEISYSHYYFHNAKYVMNQINQGLASFENNRLTEEFKNKFMMILNDYKIYQFIIKVLDMIMPTYIEDYFDKENINLYQKSIPFFHSHTGCVECYKNYIQFSLTRFYECMKDINLLIMYNGRIDDEIFEYRNGELVTKDILYFAPSIYEPYLHEYGYAIINFNNKYCKWKLAVDSTGIIENPQLKHITIDENNKDTVYTLNMLSKYTKIKAGSVIIDTDYLNNMKVINYKKIKNPNKYMHKLLYDSSSILYGSCDYFINNDYYMNIGIRYAMYDPESEKFIFKLFKKADRLYFAGIPGAGIGGMYYSYPIKYIYTNKKCHSIGHYKINKDKHYMYQLTSDIMLPNISENSGNGNKLISKYGTGLYILLQTKRY